jgi:mono/diheme cytochrome c family protein
MKLIQFILLASAVTMSAAETPNSAVPSDHAQRMERGLEIFQKEIRPLLTEHCVKCHGGEKTKGDFDLTTREGLLRGGADGPSVKLYDARSSRLFQLVSHAQEPHMPSKSDRLPDAALRQIAAWIDNGAPYDRPLVEGKGEAKKDRGTITDRDRQWWAFQPLQRTEPPKVKTAKTARNSVDQFILARLEAAKLKLNPPADRRTLLRRASFNLHGMPPTPEAVDEFARDKSPDAWPRIVARLLDSPRYGERWARHWLDVARFAESSGFEHDNDRPNAYHYRDFVIKALNADMPYDQFVRWQIAGDEFAPDDPLALMATGFLGAGVFPTQITANEVERTRYDAMDDMLATTGTAMLGLTVGCARCHDHKFDPIPARDYYRMLATFTTTVRSDISLDLEPDESRRAKEAFDREHAPLVAALKSYEERELSPKFDAWISAGAPLSAPATWALLEATESKSKAGATFKKLDDGSYLAEGKNGDTDVYTLTGNTPDRDLRALRLEALAHSSMVKGGPGRADNGNIGLSRIRVFASPLAGGETNEVKLIRPRATFEQNSNTLSIASALDDNPKTGWAVDPKFGTNHAAIFEFEHPVGFEGGTRLRVRLEFELNTRHNIGRPRLAVTTAAAQGFDGDALPSGVAGLLAKIRGAGAKPAALAAADRLLLLNWWRASEPGWQALHSKVEAHARQAPKPKLTKVLICGEGHPALRMHTQGADFFKETHFLHRGSTDLKKGVATPGFLQVLLREPELEKRWQWQPPAGAKFSGRRRTLANWMTDTDQGAGHLLARVIVNRLWQHHFGQGLVTTPNDFGAQGAKPTHPELLDWLAAELIRGGWRLKPLHQLLMTSAVYQQQAGADPAKVKADPANALLSRRHPQRLQAEAVRDSLLFVSGVLDTNMFGPGTLDQASRRRSIYFTVKRSQMIPAMQAFDAPEPLVSQGTRPTTTVAPQALLLMNSPHVRSWAAAFAQRLATTPEPSPAEAVARAYTLALNRPPTKSERADAVAFIEEQMLRYQTEQKADARQLALTDFAQVVLGLNEFIYVD